MKPLRRSSLILSGASLLYLAFLIQSLSGLPLAGSIVPWGAVAVSIPLTLAVVYVCGWMMARGRGAVESAAAAFLLFLLNPLMNDPALFVSVGDLLKEAIGPVALATAWIWMEHWSVLMRALGLSAVVAMGLVLGAVSAKVVIIALGIWMIFNRRPAKAALMFVLILLVSGFLYQSVMVLYGIFGPLSGDPLSVWKAVAHRHRMFWDLGSWWGGWLPAQAVFDRAARFLEDLSPSWWLLALWVSGERFFEPLRERRSGVEFFLATVVLLGTFSGLLVDGTMRTELCGMLVISTAVIPLLAVDLTQKELLLSRAGRISAGGGFFFSAMAVLTHRWWAGLAALGVAYVFSSIVVRADWLLMKYRLKAILAGAVAGSWLAASFSLFRN